MKGQGSTLERLYNDRFSATESYRNRVWRVICQTFFQRYISKSARILDLGTGWGEFIINIAAGEKYAIDLNPASKERLPPDIKHFNQDCSQIWPFVSETFDVIFTSNFLEHLHDKQSIERVASEAYRCLKDDGLFICMGPNIKYAFREYWDFWDHHIPLTDLSCSELLRSSGFTIERSVARFLPYTMSNRRNLPFFLVHLYLRLPILWHFFGKQFLIIAKKSKSPSTESI